MSIELDIKLIDKGLENCAALGDNHSKDRVLVYYGGCDPITLCGYHSQNHLKATLTEIGQK